MAMNQCIKKDIINLIKSMTKALSNLYLSWQYDKVFEEDWETNWNDHCEVIERKFLRAAMQNHVINARLVEVGLDPFDLTFIYQGWRIKVSVNTKGIDWKAERAPNFLEK